MDRPSGEPARNNTKGDFCILFRLIDRRGSRAPVRVPSRSHEDGGTKFPHRSISFKQNRTSRRLSGRRVML